MDKYKSLIVFYSPGLYPCKTGGMEIYNYHLYKTLIEEKKEINFKVLTDCDKNNNRSENYYPLQNRKFLIRRVGLGTLSTLLHYLFFSKELKLRQVEKIFIPYTNNFEWNALPFLLIHYIFGIKYCIHIHSGNLKKWKTPRLQKLFFEKADNIAGVSLPIVKTYEKRSGKKIKYLPPILPFIKSDKTIHQIKSDYKLNEFSNIILFVGTLKPLKNPETLLKAFLKIEDDFIQNHKVGLLIIGDGELKTTLENKYQNKNVFFTGQVANNEIKHFYKAADLFVISSLFEGTPIVLLEAQYNGLLCIGSDIESIRHIIQDNINGRIFNTTNYIELSKIIKECIEMIEISNNMRKKSMKYYHENYKYGQHIKEVIEFIHE